MCSPSPQRAGKEVRQPSDFGPKCHTSISLRRPPRLKRKQRRLYIRPADIRHRLASTQQLTGKMLNYSLPFPLLKSPQQNFLQIYINEQCRTYDMNSRLA